MAYSEQDGRYRQAGKNSGETAHLYPRSKSSTTVLGIWFICLPVRLKSSRCPALLGWTAEGGCLYVFSAAVPTWFFLQRLLNYFKSPADLVPQVGKLEFEH